MKSLKSMPNNLRLGIWGSSGAGKTTYMTMLFLAFRNLSDWTIQSVNDEADEFIRKNYKRIAKGYFPDRTEIDLAEDEKLKIHSYRLSHNLQDHCSITLNFIDAPGEYYESMDTALKVDDPNQPDREMDIVDYLMGCDGIIFLLDPDPDGDNKNKDAYSTMLFDLFVEFNKRNRKNSKIANQRLEQYIAFCVTKTDHDKVWKKALTKDADAYVEDLIAPMMTLTELSNDIWLQLDKNKRTDHSKYNRCQFFYTSCLGRHQKNGKSHSIYISDKTPEPKLEPESESEISSGWDNDYTWNNDPGNSDSNSTAPSQSQDRDDSYGPTGSNAYPLSSKLPGGRIKSGIRLKPSNVYEPVLWLIEGISLCRPNRQQRH